MRRSTRCEQVPVVWGHGHPAQVTALGGLGAGGALRATDQGGPLRRRAEPIERVDPGGAGDPPAPARRTGSRPGPEARRRPAPVLS